MSPEEQAFLDGPVKQLCHMINSWQINHVDREVPQAIWDFLKQEGFLGLIIPKTYGGREFSALGHAEVIATIATVNVAVATVVSVPNSLGPAELLLHYGTAAQKNHYLPRLAKGEEVPCFALTSPLAGSDAAAIEDYGVVVRRTIQGESVLGMELSWSKRYITLAPVATVLGLAFKLYDPDHLLSEETERGITCALIPVNTPGVITGRRHCPLTSPFPNGPTAGDKVFVPLDAVIGGPEYIGRGWMMLMECLAAGRAISLPSMANGNIQRAVFASGPYTRIREQFHVPVGEFGGVQQALARLGGYAYAATALRLFTIARVDDQEASAVASAISKAYTTEWAREIIRLAMDVHGGKGICMGPKNYLAQTHIESPISITVEGANILTRSLIVFGQGVIRCHPFLLKEMQAVNNPDGEQGLRDFDQTFWTHAGALLGHHARALTLRLTRGRLSQAPQGTYRRYYQQINRFSAALALVSDVSLVTLGGRLKREEMLSFRLADIFAHLYALSAVLKYAEQDTQATPFVAWIMQESFHIIEQQLRAFLVNFPIRWARTWMRFFTLSWRTQYPGPVDAVSQAVAQQMMLPGGVRMKLAARLYRADHAKKTHAVNPFVHMEETLTQVLATDALRHRVLQAVKEKQVHGKTYDEKIQHAEALQVITPEEAKVLRDTRAAVLEWIHVDDFATIGGAHASQ